MANKKKDELEGANQDALQVQRRQIESDPSLDDEEREKQIKEFEDEVRNHPLTEARQEAEKSAEEERKKLEKRREEEREEREEQVTEVNRQRNVAADNTDKTAVGVAAPNVKPKAQGRNRSESAAAEPSES